jgi:putative transposase
MEPLQPGKYYHIYNRGNNREDLFRVPDNYQHFLRLYEKYIHPIADTFAWVLMKNHFHLLVRIKEEGEINFKDLTGFQNLSGLRLPLNFASQQFSNLFNAYTKAFNKYYNRTGTLFERPFHRISIDSDRYFRQLVVYIHNNPVHHGFTPDFKDYPWSSYGSILSFKPTKLSREKVIGWFDDKANFVAVHNRATDMELIKEFVIE